jgi:type IV secretory pathway VirB10-like protein
MLNFLKSRPTGVILPQEATAAGAPSEPGTTTLKPEGQISPRRIRLLVIVGIVCMTAFLIYSGQSTHPKAAQQKQIRETATAAQAAGGFNASRNYSNTVDQILTPPTVAPLLGQPLPATPGYQNQTAATGNAQPTANQFYSGMNQTPGSPSPVPSASATQARRNPQLEAHEAMLAEQDKRETDSLAAGVIVRSERLARTPPTVAAASQAAATAAPNFSAAPPLTQPNPSAPPNRAIAPTSKPLGADSDDLPSRQSRTRTANAAALNKASGPSYKLFEGTLIEAVLTHRLNSSFTGPVECMVTTNIWSHSRQHLLIPQGTKALGEAKRVTRTGQDRVAVVFHRLVMPDGYSVSLDTFTGLSQGGETGLHDKVNHHYLQIFGASVALGAISGLAVRGTSSGINQTSSDNFRQGFGQQLSSESTTILDRFLNIMPTVLIREGVRVKIYLLDDISLPAFDNHAMPNDL